MTDLPSADLAIVVVNFGEPYMIAANLGADLTSRNGLQVVIVDNFHSDAARARTEQLCQERGWVLVASENDGFGAGVNRGVRAAQALGARSFVTVNPDAVATAEVLRELGREVSTDPDSLASPWMDSSDGSPHFRGTSVSMKTGQIRTSWSPADTDPEWKNWLSGACLAFSLTAFERLDGFAENFFLYWEDVDFSRRGAELGMRLVLRDDLRVIHDEGGTQINHRARSKSPTYYYYNIRNRLLFGRRLLHGRQWARWLLATPRQSTLIWMRGGRRQALTEPRGVWASVRGVCAGIVMTLRPPHPVSSQTGATR